MKKCCGGHCGTLCSIGHEEYKPRPVFAEANAWVRKEVWPLLFKVLGWKLPKNR